MSDSAEHVDNASDTGSSTVDYEVSTYEHIDMSDGEDETHAIGTADLPSVSHGDGGVPTAMGGIDAIADGGGALTATTDGAGVTVASSPLDYRRRDTDRRHAPCDDGCGGRRW